MFNLHALFHKNRAEREMDDELRFHLEKQIEQNIASGMSKEEARYAALRQFGNVGAIKEECRDSWGVRFINELAQDLRYGLRQLRSNPGFTIVAVFTLALGMAAAVAIFGFVDSALIRPLPYPNLARLMGVFKTSALGGQQLGYSYPDYLDLERFNTVFASIAAYDGDKDFVLSDAGSVHPVNGIGVTGNFFRILGVTPILGRDFVAHSASEDLLAAPSTVILSYAAWQKWFGGRPDVLGKAVTLNGESYTVIGVLPRSFQFAPTGASEFWTTLRPFAGDPCQLSRGCMAMGVIARLKDGVSLQQALADVRAIAAQEARQHPDPDRDRGANIVPLSQVILGNIRPVLLALFGGTGLLLLIAYFNVASLLLVRSENRRREFAVRGAFGAPRRRLVQQFVTEGLALVVISGGLGLLAAMLVRRLLLRLIPSDMLNLMPYLRRSGWSWHVAAFAMVLVLVACALFAITPATRLPFANLRAALAEGDRGAAGTAWRRLGARLAVLELATTMVLLAGAGLLGKSFSRLMHVDLGFVPSHVATLSILAPESKYSNSEQAIALQREIVSRLQSLPGMTAAGAASDLPVGGEGGTQIGFVGRPSLGENNAVGHILLSPGYLSVLQARLLRGRYFNENDNANAPLVAVINQTLARRYFAGENPIGKQFFYHSHGSDAKLDGPGHPTQIVGVIADVKQNALDGPATPVVYTPFDQEPGPSFFIAVRTSQEAAAVLPTLIAAIHKIDPGIVTSGGATMPEIIQDSPAAYWHRASAFLAGGFAALALLLSIVGLYGVIAYSVSRRTREIGVRMALGASRGSVYRLILKEAGWLTLIGVVIGIPGSIAAGMFIRSLLFGVRSWDVSILGTVAAVLITSALLASYFPARRAACVNPVEALRTE
ncbi:MAG: ABC transporter permease [Acidobacteria bacterium]|nr:ABC transporter permease [Acidobacteriota bacterium]